MEEQTFTIQNEAGEAVTCHVVFTFDAEERSYVLFTIDGDETGQLSALRYVLNENGEVSDFEDIETEEEWAMVEEVMNTLMDEFSQDQQNFITVTNAEGDDVEYQILHRFKHPETNKDFLFYGDLDEAGMVTEVFASAYIAGANGEVTDLLPIESDEEWAFVEATLQMLQRQN
ncbi:MAG: DUF1292 domain-containing protein [Caryophanon sp.]|nr:DUF1292 domain-containing protein [Caryophanon sp.]